MTWYTDKPVTDAFVLVQVEVDLDLNATKNARAWHTDRKARSAKQAKTLEANERALAVADKKVQAQLSKVSFAGDWRSHCPSVTSLVSRTRQPNPGMLKEKGAILKVMFLLTASYLGKASTQHELLTLPD